MIRIENLTKKFGELEVLKGVSLTVNKGEVISIVGPSGAGKTTLLQLIGTLDKPTSGKILFNGEETGNPRYWEKIPAEINFPQLYHRRGALAAAREGDFVNPERKSSRTQFYIVWGRTFDAEQLARMEQRLAMQGITLPENVREAYMNEGGTPHLDGQYTVFGEVVEGLEIVDKIQGVITDDLDRPVEDVRIIKAERVK
jgi:ABC-type cobalamin/Fe3+-siderophores transport system ATPase subunit